MTAPRPRPTLARILVAAGANRRAARAPFVLLVVALLASGLIALLLLNASVNQGAFQLSRLKRQTTTSTDEEQALQQRVDRDAAPGSLAAKARKLGMVPGGDPVFLAPDGAVRGASGGGPAAPAAPPPSPAPGGSPLATIDPSTQAGSGGANAAPNSGR